MLPVIGRVERIRFTTVGNGEVPAKVDTGAYRSSVWASEIKEQDGILSFYLFAPGSPYFVDKVIQTSEYRKVSVENSFGHSQERYSVFLSVEVSGLRIKSNFTLANRSKKTYPVLIGRKMLKGRFIVDVSRGTPLEDEEKVGDDSLE